MEKMSIAAAGLHAHDSLVLRSTLHLLADENCRWRLVDDARDADVLLRRMPADNGADARDEPVPRLQLEATLASTGLAQIELTLPLRARDLASHLRRAAACVVRAGQRHTAAASPSHPVQFVDFLLSGTSCLGLSSAVLRIGARHDLLIDPLQSAPADLLALRWRSWSIHSLRELCERVSRGAPVSLEVAPPTRGEASAPLCTGSVRKLVMALALFDPQPQPVTVLQPDARLSLLRWPDFGDLPLLESQLRMAALLGRGPISVAQFSVRAGVADRDRIAFLNACHWLKYLAVDSAAPEALAEPVAVPRAGHRWGSLMHSIRTALRGSGVGESP